MQSERVERPLGGDAGRACPSRVVVIQGQSFCVREEQSGRAGNPETTLVFSSDRIARRVRSYPRDWFSLPDEALAQLSWGR